MDEYQAGSGAPPPLPPPGYTPPKKSNTWIIVVIGLVIGVPVLLVITAAVGIMFFAAKRSASPAPPPTVTASEAVSEEPGPKKQPEVDPTRWTEITLPSEEDLPGSFYLATGPKKWWASPDELNRWKDASSFLDRGTVTREPDDNRQLLFAWMDELRERAAEPEVLDLGMFPGDWKLPYLRRSHSRVFYGRITDAKLVHLSGIAALEGMDLTGCKGVTDAGLVHLRGLTALRTLKLASTKVTDDGVEDLQKALPECKITR